jgi:hypothetical protein
MPVVMQPQGTVHRGVANRAAVAPYSSQTAFIDTATTTLTHITTSPGTLTPTASRQPQAAPPVVVPTPVTVPILFSIVLTDTRTITQALASTILLMTIIIMAPVQPLMCQG